MGRRAPCVYFGKAYEDKCEGVQFSRPGEMTRELAMLREAECISPVIVNEKPIAESPFACHLRFSIPDVIADIENRRRCASALKYIVT